MGIFRPKIWKLLSAVLALALVIGGFVLYLMEKHNFHVVSAGRIYRSAQLDRDSLLRIIHERDIKSILNLRGPGPDDWYNAETNASKQLGLAHYDYTLSAGEELTDVQMDELIATMEHAPKPLLIHCKSGSDRTGLAGALYLYSSEGATAEVAGRELTIFRGHFPYLFWRDTIAMDRSFWRYVEKHSHASVQTDIKENAALSKPTLPAVAADH